MHMHIVILNKRKDVVALFEERSAIYSDRLAIPVCKMMYEDFDYATGHSLPFSQIRRGTPDAPANIRRRVAET